METTLKQKKRQEAGTDMTEGCIRLRLRDLRIHRDVLGGFNQIYAGALLED